MMVIRGSQVPADAAPESSCDGDPLQKRAAKLFDRQLAADRVPLGACYAPIRAELRVGQTRAQRLRAYLATRAATRMHTPAA